MARKYGDVAARGASKEAAASVWGARLRGASLATDGWQN
jgi:hypothetical protein